MRSSVFEKLLLVFCLEISSFLFEDWCKTSSDNFITLFCLVNQKAMMRKVMHHSEEIYLFVLINKLTTHFISEPPQCHRHLYFLYLELLLSSFAVHFFYSWEIDPGLCLWKRRKICSNFWFGWIICWTRWWGLPKSDPTMMRTEITLRSNTLPLMVLFSNPPFLEWHELPNPMHWETVPLHLDELSCEVAVFQLLFFVSYLLLPSNDDSAFLMEPVLPSCLYICILMQFCLLSCLSLVWLVL